MTRNTAASGAEMLVQSSLLTELRDDLNLSLLSPEKWLVVRKWKQDLIQKDYKDVLNAVQELSTTESPYIKNTLLPLLQDSLQTSTVTNLLDIIQVEYSSKLGKDSFHEKKQAVKMKLQDMYTRWLLDNKIIFWLGVFLIKNNDPKYAAGTFVADIQKWLYTWDKINTSFWQTVIPSTTPQKDETQAATTENIQDALTSSN